MNAINHTMTTSLWLVATTLFALIGCGDGGGRGGGRANSSTTGTNTSIVDKEVCKEAALVHLSTAPQWVQQRTDIRAYRARLDRLTGEVTVALLGQGDVELGIISSEQFAR